MLIHTWMHLLLVLLTMLSSVLTTMLHVLATHSLVVLATHVLSWTSIRASASLSHVSLSLIHLSIGLLIILDDTEELLEHLSQMRLRCKIVPFKSTCLRGLIFLPIGFVTSFLHLKLSHLLDLIVVDQKDLTLTVVVLHVLLGFSSISWLLVANKGEGIAGILALVKSDVLNLTEALEQVLQVILGVMIGEVLHIQVASLL